VTSTEVTGTENVQRTDSGFSLIEAIIAVLVFIIGIAAVSNLFLMASTANSAANQMSATTALASEVMDRLRAIPKSDLVAITPASMRPAASDTPCTEPGGLDCVQAGTLVTKTGAMHRVVPGVGDIHVRWSIEGAGDVFFIRVRAQSLMTIVGERGYAEFTTFR